MIDLDPGLPIGGTQLVGLLRDDRYLRAALDAHLGADLVLRRQIAHDDLMRLANATRRTAHCPNGFSETFRLSELYSSDPDALPFRIRPEVLDSIEESLRIVPGGWQRTAVASDWALTAVWVDLTYDHKLGRFVDNPPFLTCTPG